MSKVNVTTELLLGGQWVDISADVYTREPINITRGRPDEGSKTDPGECSLTLDNRGGKYSARNPAGPYYGLLSRNTPLRVTVGNPPDGGTLLGFDGTAHDAPSVDARAADSLLICGWVAEEHAATPGTYTPPGSMTSDGQLAGDDTAMLAAHQAVAGAGATGVRTATYSQDPDSFATVAVILPGDAGAPAVEEFQSDVTDNDPVTFITAPTTEAGWWLVALHAWAFDSDDTGSSNMTVPDGTPGKWFRLADSRIRNTLRPHVVAWARRVSLDGAQEVTLNADPNDTGYDNQARLYVLSNVEPFSIRFAGEVAAWPVRWDPSESDVYTPVAAAGILRRLGQGAKALRSPVYRETLARNKRPPRNYWPCEDADGATRIASALDGAPAMTISGGPDLAAFDGFAASGDLPVMKTGRFEGRIPTYTATGQSQVQWLMHVDSSDPPPAGAPLFQFITDGSAVRWQIRYESGGGLSVRVFGTDQSIISDTGPVAFNVDNRLLRCALEIRESGGDIEHVLATLEVGESSGVSWTTNITGHDTGVISKITCGLQENLNDTAIGHVSVHDEATTIFNLEGALRSWVAEPAGDRIARLCREEDVPFDGFGDLAATPTMGPQAAAPLLDLLGEAVEADGGVLYEPRERVGLAYRTRASLYNQGAA